MLKSLDKNDVPWILVDAVFDWSAKPCHFMTIEEICFAAGFNPTTGDAVSVSRFLGRKKIDRVKIRGERGAIVPPFRIAKTASLV